MVFLSGVGEVSQEEVDELDNYILTSRHTEGTWSLESPGRRPIAIPIETVRITFGDLVPIVAATWGVDRSRVKFVVGGKRQPLDASVLYAMANVRASAQRIQVVLAPIPAIATAASAPAVSRSGYGPRRSARVQAQKQLS
jgi:hypothetical protein